MHLAVDRIIDVVLRAVVQITFSLIVLIIRIVNKVFKVELDSVIDVSDQVESKENSIEVSDSNLEIVDLIPDEVSDLAKESVCKDINYLICINKNETVVYSGD